MASLGQNPQSLPVQHSQLINFVRMHTFAPEYRETLHQIIEQQSAFLETLLAKLLETLLAQSSLQIQTDSPAITIRAFLNRVFEHNQLWGKITQEVWINLLTWAVQDLEHSIACTVISTIAQEPYREDLWQLLISTNENPNPILERLEILICRDLNAQLLQNTQTIESLLLGLSIEQNITEIPIPTLTIHPCSALDEKCENSHSSPQSLSVSQAEPSSASPLILEHYLTRPSELYRLPWELMAQVKQQCGLPMVQLLFLLIGHSIRQAHPVMSPFTLTYSEIQEQLDWAVNSEASPSPDLIHLLQQLTDLTIVTIWMTEPSATQVEAYHTSGHPWDLLSEAQGNFDWVQGRIAQPTEQFITLRPGLWLHHLLQQGGVSALSAWESFGKNALKLLERDHCRDSFLISLLISLSLNAPQPHPEAKPSLFTVQNLLDMALPASVPQSLQLYPDTALSLLKTWNHALEALVNLGWSGNPTRELSNPTDFYLAPYPDWLKINSHSRKPSDWISQWLSQPLQFMPPTDLMGPPPSSIENYELPAQSQRPQRRLRFDRLSGSEIRRARKAKQLTQSQLAEILHVHQSLIAKIEVGQRSISEELEQTLRQILEI
jgi:DNA-binding XRE family transcriptional regulator